MWRWKYNQNLLSAKQEEEGAIFATQSAIHKACIKKLLEKEKRICEDFQGHINVLIQNSLEKETGHASS